MFKNNNNNFKRKQIKKNWYFCVSKKKKICQTVVFSANNGAMESYNTLKNHTDNPN